MILRATLLSAVAVVSCRGGERPPGPAPDAPPATEAPDFPPTNDGVNVRKNLDAEIEMYEQRPEIPSLVPRLAQRAMFYGRIADRERALAKVEEWIKAKPEGKADPMAYYERASLLSAFHRFDEALADMKRIPARGDALMAEILMATGKADEALALREGSAKASPNVVTLGALGVALGEVGRLDEAEATLLSALKKHRNTSPFPVSWIQFQRGLLWEERGELARARRLYEDAAARLPGYAAATGHLAGVLAAQGDRKRAIELLRPLLESSDDPEYVAQLAALLRAEGNPTEADALAARAKARYDELLGRHPAAFAAHAARFHLGEGKDPKRAAELAAQANADDLLAEARLALKDVRGACEAAAAGMSRPHPSKQKLAVYWRAFSACKDEKRAAEVDARLKSAGGR